MTNNDNNSLISTFFNSKSVFITGGTGFVGKQIIEKLLRSCSGIDNIYILIRSKGGINVNQRINKLCLLPLFDKVRLLNPNFESKLIPIIGDLTKTNFDLNNQDQQMLIDNCNIVINSGASVRFNQPLKEAIKSNVYSVENLINLCKKMKSLKVIVHISTGYIHCYRTDINEIIYPMNEDPNVLLQSLEHFNDKIVENLSNKILKNYPNTYTYTKSLAEYLILQEAHSLPIAIIRPSIIGAAWKEPIPGWVDGYAGATSIIVALGKRLLRTGLTNFAVDFPMIPVDVVANMTIAISWFTAINYNSLSTPIVYNCSTGTNNKTSLSLEDFFRTTITEQKAIQFEDYSIIEPSIILTMNRPYYYFQRFIGETFPAYLMDIIAYLTLRKARMVKLSNKVNSLKDSMKYFCQHQWIFSDKNSKLLQNQMNQIDRQEFNFDLTELNWSFYLRNYCIGIKKYLLKEDLPQISSKQSFIKTKIIHRFISILLFFGIIWIMRQIFRRRSKIIWKYFNLILQNNLQKF